MYIYNIYSIVSHQYLKNIFCFSFIFLHSYVVCMCMCYMFLILLFLYVSVFLCFPLIILFV